MPHVEVIGLSPDGPAGLKPELIQRVQQADFLAGGERHLRQLRSARGVRFILKNNLDDLLTELRARLPEQHCVVLASGDPLFYGIGTFLSERLGSANVRIQPAVSSMQLAFARAGISWQNAALASIHGRDLRTTLLPLLGRRIIGLFTQDGSSPAAVARFFLERGLGDYEAILGENLGTEQEFVSRFAELPQLLDKTFAPLNYLILRSTRAPGDHAEMESRRNLCPGIPDDAFARPGDGLSVMTRQEVRSVLLGKIGPVDPGGTLWDIGAGLGTVSVEVAVLHPEIEVVAVERNRQRAAFARMNRERFGAYNIRVVEGSAPAVLVAEAEQPCVVFIGGSGADLAALLSFAGERLRPQGRLLANFVTLEHLSLMLQWLRERRWPFAITEIAVARSDCLAGLTGLKPQRQVFLVSSFPRSHTERGNEGPGMPSVGPREEDR
jgi:precorrin-6Y C5,15-methyltransferase (decarboxylating)